MSSARHESDKERLHGHLDKLQQQLPDRFAAWIEWLRLPRARWVRVPAGVALICGGFLGFLPILGFWMLPLGLLLLAIDIPLLRRPTTWLLERIARLLTRFAAPRIPGQ